MVTPVLKLYSDIIWTSQREAAPQAIANSVSLSGGPGLFVYYMDRHLFKWPKYYIVFIATTG